ncbi:hypothetical protein DPMN_122995 [Dreissena polymorpha]|uniref:Uncharacterized protein n=1 Tax=Dreissena polymorpha TaxID=45954 RepID=A0A9D4GSW0_DREPO|nr:hypothetical protein DPMN_122995 [Dreissena polymorpha]
MASPDPDILFNLRSNNDTSDNINTENQHHENDENDTQNHRPSVDRHMPDDDRFVNVTGDAEHYFSSNNNSSHTHRETQLSRHKKPQSPIACLSRNTMFLMALHLAAR